METRAGGVEAGGLRATGRGALAKTAFYYSAFVVLGLAASIVGPSIPSLAGQTRTTLGQVSYLWTSLFSGYLLGSLAAGWLYDRVPGHPVMGSVLVAVAAALFFVPLVPLLWVLIAVFFVLGFAEGVIDVGGNILVVWVHGVRVAPFMNGLHFSFGFGAFVSPFVFAQALRSSGGIRWAYWVLCLLLVPVAALFFRSHSPEIRSGSTETGRNDRLLVAFISALFFMHIGGELSFGGWIYTYASRKGLAGEIAAAWLTSTFWGSLTLGRLLGVRIVSFVKPRNVLLAAFSGAVLAPGILIALPGSRAALWACTALMGLSIASMVPMCFTFAGSCLDMSGKVASWFMVGASVGAMAIPLLIGKLFEPRGPGVTMRILIVDFAAALLLFLFVRRYTAKRACRRAGCVEEP